MRGPLNGQFGQPRTSHRELRRMIERGDIQIVGQQPAAPPAGRYLYAVPCLIKRENGELDIDSVNVDYPAEMGGGEFQALKRQAREALKQQPGAPIVKIVLLQPTFLGFVPQEVVDRIAAGEGQAKETKET